MRHAAAAHRLSCGKSAGQTGGQRYLSPGHTQDAWDAIMTAETALVFCYVVQEGEARFFAIPNSRVDCLCCLGVSSDGTVMFYHSQRAPRCTSMVLQLGGSLGRLGPYLCSPIVKLVRSLGNLRGLQLWSLTGSRCVP